MTVTAPQTVIQEAATINGIPPRAVHAAFTVTRGSRLRLLTHEAAEASCLAFVRVAGEWHGWTSTGRAVVMQSHSPPASPITPLPSPHPASVSALLCDGVCRGTLLGALPGLTPRGNAALARANLELQHGAAGCTFRLVLKYGWNACYVSNTMSPFTVERRNVANAFRLVFKCADESDHPPPRRSALAH